MVLYLKVNKRFLSQNVGEISNCAQLRCLLKWHVVLLSFTCS